MYVDMAHPMQASTLVVVRKPSAALAKKGATAKKKKVGGATAKKKKVGKASYTIASCIVHRAMNIASDIDFIVTRPSYMLYIGAARPDPRNQPAG
jgi:hypothetical protein